MSSRWELTRRSGEQFDIWQAVFASRRRWLSEADLRQSNRRDRPHGRRLLERALRPSRDPQRDWSTLGPKLQGKLHVYVGSADNYFLNNAVYMLEDFLKTTKPALRRRSEIRRPRRALLERRPDAAELLSRLHYNTMYLPRI